MQPQTLGRTLPSANAALACALLFAGGGCSEPKPTLTAQPLVAPPASAPGAVAPTAQPATGYLVDSVMEGGTIKGKVSLTGVAPKLPSVRCARDADVCGKPRPNQTLLVDAHGGIKDVIVSLTDIHTGKPQLAAQAKLDIKQCAYAPRVQAVPVGTNLTVTSRDQVPHDLAGSLRGRNVFNRVVLRNSEKVGLFNAGVVTIGCDSHGGTGASTSCETGAIGVMANPYYAVTGEDGAFRITDVPAGTYTLQAWHETLGEQTQKVTLAANASALADVHFAVKPK